MNTFKITLFLCLFILSINFVYSQSERDLNTESDFKFNLTGYVFNLSSYSYSRSNQLLGKIDFEPAESVSDLMRLRLRPTVLFGENTRFEAQYEVNGLLSDRNLYKLNEISENKRQAVKLAWNIHTDEHLVLNHYIDRLFVKQVFDFGEFTAGRQRISWGVGRVWQPTDLFNPLNPANFSKIEKDGVDAVSTKIYIGNFTDLELVYNNTMSKYKDNFGGRFRTNYKEYDLSAVAGYFDGRIVVGGDFTGNLYDAGFRGEFIYSLKGGNFEKEFLKFILGLDYQFDKNIYTLIEYQHNGEGTICRYCYDYTRLVSGEILNVGMNYIAVNANYRINDLTNAGISNNINLNDGSGFASVSGIYQLTQSWQLNLTAMLTYGDIGTEYRIYPYSLYLLTEYFF